MPTKKPTPGGVHPNKRKAIGRKRKPDGTLAPKKGSRKKGGK